MQSSGACMHFPAQGIDEGVRIVAMAEQILINIEAPNYPATCDWCGEVGTNATMANHECEDLRIHREEGIDPEDLVYGDPL